MDGRRDGWVTDVGSDGWIDGYGLEDGLLHLFIYS